MPDDDPQRPWEYAAGLAADWVWERSRIEGVPPLLVTSTFHNAVGIDCSEEIARKGGQATPQGRQRFGRGPVLAYVPDERTLKLALDLARGHSLAVVETVRFPLAEWAAGADFNSYKNGGNHRYTGGLVRSTPFRITVPRTGSWYLTIDLMGLKATSVRHSATIESPPLPTAKSASLQSLSGIRHDRPPIVPDDNGETWDVFISHASEDKEAIAEPLAEELRARGLRVWLDMTELRIGDSLRRKIDYGLAHSTFGVVILSKSFFAKGWPQYELDGIVGMSVNGEQRMLPIWHEISRDESNSQDLWIGVSRGLRFSS